MDTSWVKLYRKARNNEIMRDPTAWVLFSWLLLSVDKDTGMKRIGRFWLAKELGVKPSTLYDALKRLEKKYSLVTLTTSKTTIKYTIVTIKKWHFYQADNRLTNNQPTINQQSTNTLQEIRIENKEKKIFNIIFNDKDYKTLQTLKAIPSIELSDWQLRQKSSIEAVLNLRYPVFKFEKEWNEARALSGNPMAN